VRKIVAGLFVSVDGVVEAPETWTGAYFSPEIGQVVGSLIAAGDTLLLGRRTYETFAQSFAGASGDDPMAAQMNAIRKVVVSTTLESADWQNSTLVSHDVEQAVTALKEEDGANINMSGSATLVAALLRMGHLDELDLLVFPVVVGQGRRLFHDEGNSVPLQVLRSETFDNGVIHVTYGPAEA
jgi:dihydrofolate reductase